MDNFINRLTEILKFYGLSASSFADKIEVQRSSISHLLSGRNKPSLDFILRVINNFPEVDLYWLLQGKGVFPLDNNTKGNPFTPTKTQENKKTISSTSKKIIEKIVIFYSDGTFESYKNT